MGSRQILEEKRVPWDGRWTWLQVGGSWRGPAAAGRATTSPEAMGGARCPGAQAGLPHLPRYFTEGAEK